MILNKPQYKNVTPGLHRGRLHSFKDLGSKDYGYGPHPMVELLFDTDEMNDAGTHPLQVRTLVTATLHSDSKLHAIASALLGGTIPDSLTLESLVGLECTLVIDLKTGKKGRTFSWVKSVLPAKTSEAAPSNPTDPTSKPLNRLSNPWGKDAGQDFDLSPVNK